MPDNARNVLGPADMAQRIADSPFAVHLGVSLDTLDDDKLRIRLDLRPELVGSQFTGFPHGGVIATLVDIAGCYMIVARIGQSVATADLSVDYLRRPRGDALFATGRIVKIGRRLSVGSVEITDSADRQVAVGKVIATPVAT